MTLSLPNPVKSLAGRSSQVLATLWHISRRDGVQFRFTTHDTDVQFDDGQVGLQTFTPVGAPDFSAQRREGGLEEQERDARGAISSDQITSADLQAGLFTEAEVVEYLVDPRFPWAGAYWVFRYWFGESRFDGEAWQTQVLGTTHWLEQSTGRSFGRDCDADVFDSRCGLSTTDEAWYEVSGVRVLAGSQGADEPRRVFAAVFADIPSSGPLEDEYKHGRLTWTSGANSGIVSEVKLYGHTSTPSQRDFEVTLPTSYAIADNDEFTVRSGCDRTRDTCFNKFDNLVNYRGFPFMPGSDDALQTPDVIR